MVTKKENKVNKVEYRLQGATTGFGYKVIQINFYDDLDKPEKPKRVTKPVFHTASVEQGKKALEHFKTKGKTTLIPNKKWEPMLLLFTEKHGTLKFFLKSEEDLFNICYEMVKRRNDEGWYSHFNYVSSQIEEITEEYVNSITHIELKKQAEELRKRYINQIKEQKENKRLKMMLDNILKTQNGIEAFYFLREMRGGEYEDFQLDSFDNDLFLNH